MSCFSCICARAYTHVQSTPELVGRVQRSRNAQKRWGLCKVLVIDEISMMEADLFDKLNIVAQRYLPCTLSLSLSTFLRRVAS